MKKAKKHRILALALAIVFAFSAGVIPALAQETNNPAAATIQEVKVAPEVAADTVSVPVTIYGTNFSSATQIKVSWKVQDSAYYAGSGFAQIAEDGKSATINIHIGKNAAVNNIQWLVSASVGNSTLSASFTQKGALPKQNHSVTTTLTGISISHATYPADTISVPVTINGVNLNAKTADIVWDDGGNLSFNGSVVFETASGAAYSVVIPENTGSVDKAWKVSASIAGINDSTVKTSFIQSGAPDKPVLSGPTQKDDVDYPKATLYFSFNKDMNRAGSVDISPKEGGNESAKINWESDTEISVECSNLIANQGYLLTFTGLLSTDNLAPESNTADFTTKAPTPPRIVDCAPAKDATGVSVKTSDVTLEFDQLIGTIGTVTVSGPGHANGTVLTSRTGTGNKKLTFTGLSSLVYGETYTVSISGFKNEQGDLMDPYSYPFTIEKAPEVKPEIKSTTPADKATNITVNVGEFTLVFKDNVTDIGTVVLNGTNYSGTALSLNTGGAGGKQFVYKLPDLAAGSKYTVTVDGFKNGAAIMDQAIITFETQAAGPAPKVESVIPSGGSVNVSTNLLTITFDMPMDAFIGTVSINNSAALSSPKWDGNKKLSYTLSGLRPGIEYSVDISGFKNLGKTVMAGIHKHKFITASSDTTLPTVISLSPTGNSVPLYTNKLRIEFSEAMDTAKTGKVMLNSMQLSNPKWTGNTIVEYTLTSLAAVTTYKVTIQDFADLAGNVMAADVNRSFRTASKDTVSPWVSSYDPSGNSINANTTKLSITFNEPMDPAFGSVNIDRGISLSSQRWIDEYTVEYTMSSLSYNREYEITIRNFRDKSGNVMNTAYKTFRTETNADYTVTYYANGGSGSMSDSPFGVDSGDSHTVVRNEFTRSNYRFVEWNTRSNGNGTSYNRGDVIRNIRSDISLYAIWSYEGSSGSSSGTTVNPSGGGTAVSSSTVTNSIEKQLDRNENPSLELGKRATEIEITGRTLNKVADNKRSLKIIKDEMTMTLSSEFISSLNLSSNDDAEICIKPTTATVRNSVYNIDKDNEDLVDLAFETTISINGKNHDSFAKWIDMTLDISDLGLTTKQKDKLTGVRFISSNEYVQLGGTWNGNKFTFKTATLSKYGVLITDNITKILMNVGSTAFTLNGGTRYIDVAPAISNGRTMVPIRFVAESFGATVEWYDPTKTVTIHLDGKTLHLTVGVLSSGMDVPPYIANDRVLIPIRYVSENFGANVLWDETNKSIEIVR